MPIPIIPNLTGWELFCDDCRTFRDARLSAERDAGTQEEYYDVVCNTCHAILVTFRRVAPTERHGTVSEN